jgi:hypothetical protein
MKRISMVWPSLGNSILCSGRDHQRRGLPSDPMTQVDEPAEVILILVWFYGIASFCLILASLFSAILGFMFAGAAETAAVSVGDGVLSGS